jgi:PPM family protein phosphatase
VLLEVNEHRVEPGDIYVMCSDGLSDMVDDQGIAEILGHDVPLEQKVAQLIDAANGNGGRDNISVLVAQANEGSKKRGLISRLLGK